MNTFTKTKIFYIVLGIIIILCVVLYLYKDRIPKQNPITLKCPEFYATHDEYMAALNIWIHQQVANNPNVTAEDLYKVRYNFLLDHNCTKTLQTLRDNLPSGVDATPANIIKNELKTYNVSQ